MGERSPETPCWGHKDDSRGHSNYRIIQEGPKNLPQDGPECPVNGLCTKIARKESPIIVFSEDNARRLHHPHDDAIVVSIWVGDYNVHRMLVDNGSKADILYYPAFQQMGINRARLTPMNAPLVGFGGTRVHPLGAVTLSVTVGDYP